MQKREFEQAYGRRVSLNRWREIEKAYIESDALDRLDFVAELKASEAAERFKKQAAKAEIEIERHNVTEAQFKSYVRRRLTGHPLESWRNNICADTGHGACPYGGRTDKDGTEWAWRDENGHFQSYWRNPDGKIANLILDFDLNYDGTNKGYGYCYIRDDTVKQLAGA